MCALVYVDPRYRRYEMRYRDHQNHISNSRTVEPVSEPVTIQQLDAQLRGDGILAQEEPEFLAATIKAAREYVEEFTRRALINQTWRLTMDYWPSTKEHGLGWWDGVRQGSLTMDQQGYVELPIAPLQAVAEVRTFNQDNTSQVFASSNYFLDTGATPGQLILNDGITWPIFTRTRNGIQIDYVAGYGTSATAVPGALIAAILGLATHWYENREIVKTQSDQNQAMAPLHVQSVLNRWKVQKL